ncbi:MAG: hypothetical protein H6976_11285 [Gammaproteobacteria bacterium]|nr:hypothetical protein [Gammaproteobacteria bacterium]
MPITSPNGKPDRPACGLMASNADARFQQAGSDPRRAGECHVRFTTGNATPVARRPDWPMTVHWISVRRPD